MAGIFASNIITGPSTNTATSTGIIFRFGTHAQPPSGSSPFGGDTFAMLSASASAPGAEQSKPTGATPSVVTSTSTVAHSATHSKTNTFFPFRTTTPTSEGTPARVCQWSCSIPPAVGGDAAGTFGATASQSGALGKQQSTTGTGTGPETLIGGSAFGQPQQQQPSTSSVEKPKSASRSGSSPSQLSRALYPSKLECIEELLRKSLLGEELLNTQFHLFSARSSTSGRVMKPRVLCANNAFLAKSSTYFKDLLSADEIPSDPSLVDLTRENDVPSHAPIDDYDYDDSDLDECDESIPFVNTKPLKDWTVESPKSPSKVSAETQLSKDSNDLSDDAKSVASSEIAVRETAGNNGLADQTRLHLRSLGSRHILVKNSAFQTWYTLLNYLYTGKFSFLPLSSTILGRQYGSSTSSLDAPRCSAKSMYRLASKVGLDYLRDAAFVYIRSNLTAHNILTELSCSVVSKYPQLLEMELDVLYSHITSPPVVANFAALAQRIAHKELPHGADIIIGIHTRLLKERPPFSLQPTVPALPPHCFWPPTLVQTDISANDGPDAGTKQKTGSSHADHQGSQSESSPASSKGNESTPSRQSQASENVAAASTKEPNTRGRKRATKSCRE
ncbi:hypothetical protein JVT61DRAFT_15052 [Boletus reticuloceps]|uniref:BTB domain-containing protein n=1 Tax=Boletus reticuloceps TaxID=495285 RepID=A0A8I2YQN4_9AGAM|nr:hypothetical protein JVT61DRAFT_15052 [Boletus reticuloceps]